jgi:multicomponent Na+:H+ antiporter subunit C
MVLSFACLIGILVACGIYCMLREGITQVLVGIMLLGHGLNLLVFSSGGLVVGRPAFVPEGELVTPAGAADPLPQALVLTAIVIGFGVTAFALALFKRCYADLGSGRSRDFQQGSDRS